MTKPSMIETLLTDTTEKTFIDAETTQTIIQDIAEEVKRKIAQAEAQASVSS